ncbi:ADP-ribosylation factor, putative [Plasmodium ovale]|uniref:ADP-ribosylation factor, putative n=2 Tax=Plasmodium ovale TaxID=36330 RepID=A0A1A8WXW3_PLAOA|nr:ADP-ribosylation factor, putative [Plasmodium ovale curtisi]SBS97206.1 ADP-ribosylation factor, putative [Plasmodium ovale curtisi]SCP05861.1 ADP-ribosylation factor, putative [Plasmodium ovale]
MVLLKIFKKIKERHRNIRIIILGLDNAGKTTIVKRLLGDDIYKVHPTFGFTIESLNFNNYFINIWDVGGQKSIRHYWKNYYENIDGIIYVIDSSDIFRIQLCSYELKKILKEERLFGCSLLILSNKNDIENSLNIGQIVEILKLNEMNIDRHWCIRECSAFSGKGLLSSFMWLVDDISYRICKSY